LKVLRSRTFWIGIVFSLAFLFLFLRGTPLSGAIKAALGANYLLLPLGIFFYFAGIWWRAVRWRLLLSPLGMVSPHRLFPPIVMGFALNNVLPGRLGMIARAYLVGEREGLSKIASGTTVVLDNMFDGLVLLLLVLLLSLFMPLGGWARHVALGALVVYGVVLLLFFSTASSPKLIRRLARPLTLLPRWGNRFADWLELVISGLGALHHPVKLIFIFFFSLLIWLSEAAMFYFIALAFHIRLPFYALILATAIANLALIIPSLPGGVGPFEYFGKQTLLLLGVEEGIATAYIGVLHMALLFPVTLLGLGFLWWQRHFLGARLRAGRQT